MLWIAEKNGQVDILKLLDLSGQRLDVKFILKTVEPKCCCVTNCSNTLRFVQIPQYYIEILQEDGRFSII